MNIENIYLLLQVNITISVIVLLALAVEIVGFVWMLREIFRLQINGNKLDMSLNALVDSANKLNEKIRSGK